MKIIKKLVIALVVFLSIVGLVFVALGIFLPDEIVVNNEVMINASPEEVWAVMEDREKYAEWSPNIEKIEIINENKWKEILKGSDEPIVFETGELEKPTKYQLKYEMSGKMKGEWKGNFEKTENGTNLKTEDKIIHQTWIGKMLMPLFFDLESFSKEFNKKIKERAESLK